MKQREGGRERSEKQFLLHVTLKFPGLSNCIKIIKQLEQGREQMSSLTTNGDDPSHSKGNWERSKRERGRERNKNG